MPKKTVTVMDDNKERLKILKMYDAAEKYRIDKGMGINLPMKELIIGKSQLSGKSTNIGNQILRPYDETDKSASIFYNLDFPGRNIYVVCPSIQIDTKWQTIIDQKQIPDGNIYYNYNEEELNDLYNRLEANFLDAVRNDRVPEHNLLILDDCSFSGKLKEKLYGVISRIASNGRHILLSIIVTAQKYSTIHTGLRENATGCIFYECSNAQLKLITEDHAIGIEDKVFKNMLWEATSEPHGFLVVNYSNPREYRYMNAHFEPMLVG